MNCPGKHISQTVWPKIMKRWCQASGEIPTLIPTPVEGWLSQRMMNGHDSHSLYG